MFWDHQGGQFDPPVGNVEGQLGPQVSDASFVGTSVSNVMLFLTKGSQLGPPH